jgi:hypothetical protein
VNKSFDPKAFGNSSPFTARVRQCLFGIVLQLNQGWRAVSRAAEKQISPLISYMIGLSAKVSNLQITELGTFIFSRVGCTNP